MGREIPVSKWLTHADLHGQFPTGDSTGFRYQVQVENSRIGKYENALNFDFGWRLRTLYSTAEHSFRLDKITGSAGLGYEQRMLLTAWERREIIYDSGKIFGSLGYPVSERMRQQIGILVQSDGEQMAVKSAFSAEWQAGESTALTANIAYAESTLREEYPF